MRRKSEFADPDLAPTDDRSDVKHVSRKPWFTGTTCPICKLAQFNQADGKVSCPNGHDVVKDEGVASIDAAFAPETQPPVPETQPPVPETQPIDSPKDEVATIESQDTGTKRKRRSSAAKSQEQKVEEGGKPAAAASVDSFVLGAGFERIVERVFSIDPWASYEALESKLKLPVQASGATYALVVDALDACEDNAREAHRLYCSAMAAVDRYEKDCVVLSVDMRQQATASLQAEKDRGERTKQITDADVESRIALMFPDEWRTLEERRMRASRMVSHMSRLADLWKERCRDVRVILETMRR